MKKQYKTTWVKALFGVFLVFGLGATVFIFSKDINGDDKEKQDPAKIEGITGIRQQILDQKNILDSLTTLKSAYDAALLEKTSLSEQLEIERKNVENLMEIIKASKNPSMAQIKIYRNQLSDMNTSLESKMEVIKNLTSQNESLLTEIESQNVVMYNQKAQNDTLISKQKVLESTLKDASKLSFNNFKVVALRDKKSGKEIETVKGKSARKFKVSFAISGNSFAKRFRQTGNFRKCFDYT